MPESFRLKAKYGKKLVHSEDAKSTNEELQSLEVLQLMADVAEEIREKYWVKVNLKEIATEKMITSVDELYSYEPGFAVIAEIAMKFVRGFAEKN